MSRKSVLVGVGLVLLVAAGFGSALALLVHHEPGFYRRCAVPPGPDRTHNSRVFVSECTQLIGRIADRAPRWGAHFTDAEINSYLEEQFVQSGTDRSFLPPGFSTPRVSIDADKIRLAFRYGQGVWSTVISIDLRVWLAKSEPNVVGLELQGLHAGALPISAQSLLDHITDACEQNKIKVRWYRHNGNPTALLRFQGESSQPSVQISQIRLQPGLLLISGRSVHPKLALNLMHRLVGLTLAAD